MSTKKMNQILAIEKGVKTRVYGEITELHKLAQQAALFNGFAKTYEPVKEDMVPLPPQSQLVQYTARDILDAVQRNLTEIFDVTASKDWGNTHARADVEVDGNVLLKDVPATYLLFLDKQLTDMKTLVGKFTELDLSAEWKRDEARGQFVTEPVATQRTEKVQDAIVMYPATEFHPAQTQLITKDVLVGHWKTVRYSGAIEPTRKRFILARIEKVQQAVKQALEAANMVPVETQRVGDKVLGYILGA